MNYTDYLQTPAGLIEIQASAVGVTRLVFPEADKYAVDWQRGDVNSNQHTDRCKQQLRQYLDGDRTQFDVPLDQAGTEFQQAVWQQLLQIPFGKTVSYQDIANALDNPKAVRAVGMANGRNPISIIVPCHRVIGSNGALTGYAGGLQRKQWLLMHEADIYNVNQPL